MHVIWTFMMYLIGFHLTGSTSVEITDSSFLIQSQHVLYIILCLVGGILNCVDMIVLQQNYRFLQTRIDLCWVALCFWKKFSGSVLEGEQGKQGMYSSGTVILPLSWSFAKLWFQQRAWPDPRFKSLSSRKDCKNYRGVGSALPWTYSILEGGLGWGLAIGAWFQFSFCFVQLLI